jgi:hypothetical protein
VLGGAWGPCVLWITRHSRSMNPKEVLVLEGDPLDDDVAELALRLAMAASNFDDVARWLVQQQDVGANLVRVVLGHPAGAELCLNDHRLVPLIAKLDPGEREVVLHGMLDAFRSGQHHRWGGHAELVLLASTSGDDDVRHDVLEPWFARMALCGAQDVANVLGAYEIADPSGEWLAELLRCEELIPIEVLAKVIERIDETHPAAAHLPWDPMWGEDWAVRGYSKRMLVLASKLVAREQWGVLARLGAEWNGSLGDLVTCVGKVT